MYLTRDEIGVIKMIDKNKRKEENKKHRIFFEMNTGTRVHKSAKYPNRKDLKKRLDKYGY